MSHQGPPLIENKVAQSLKLYIFGEFSISKGKFGTLELWMEFQSLDFLASLEVWALVGSLALLISSVANRIS